jgi:septal ring factor EnvC (AmiA/AmiB activator)
MPKGKPPAHPTESELRGAMDVLRQEFAAYSPRLRRLLAAGQDTAPLRSEIVALERRMADITAALAAIAAVRSRSEAAITAAAADQLATDA